MITEASTAPTGYRHTPLGPDDLTELLEVDHLAFAVPDGEQPPLPLEWPRTAGVRTDDGALAAIRSSFAFTLPVPGGAVPAAGLTWVAVHPAHRRRRLLTAMIAEHLRRCAARGEPVSVLTASEAGIYGRFGYGSAVPHVQVTVPRGAALRPVPGADELTVHLERADAARHSALVERVHQAAGAAGGGRPGWITRPTTVLAQALFFDPPSRRDRGTEPLRLLTVTDASGDPRAYAVFARTARPRGEDSRVRVRESAATDPTSASRLWATLLDLDLTTTVQAAGLAPDDALLHLLVDARAAAPALADHVWVRLVDVPAALSARRYPAPVDVVLEVTDALVPGNAGRWHLVGDATGARVERTEAPADLALDVRDLASAYLGGVSLAGLAAAGLVRELTPEALAPAATAFGWPLAPACSWDF